MTDPEILEWMGVTDPDARLLPYVSEALADVPPPGTGGDQLAAYRAFLAVWEIGKPILAPTGTT